MFKIALKLLWVCIALASTQIAAAQQSAATVGVQTVQRQMLSETVPVFAEIVTARNGAVASRVAGSIDTIHVLAGSTVQEGDLLLELNRDLLSIQVRQARAHLLEAEASVETAKVRLASARTSFDRIDALRESSSFSQGRFDDAQSDVQLARAQVAEANARRESAEAELAEAEYQLDRSTIRAPFAGIVLEILTIPGAFIQAGTPVATILDTEAFEIEASIPARFVVDLRPDQKVQGKLETGEVLDLKLRAILPVEDPSTRLRAVRLSASGISEIRNLAVGQSLTVDVPVGEEREVTAVPKDALVQAQGGWTVFVVADGKAQLRQVQIGVPAGDRYEVINGLTAGDQVIVRGNERLRPGQAISPSLVETN